MKILNTLNKLPKFFKSYPNLSSLTERKEQDLTPLASSLVRRGRNISPLTKGGLRGVSWFTLVELIIVITILAILAVIAFVSFENFTKDTRDANRVAVMKNIENGLEIFAIKSESGKYPMPDSPETLTGSNNQGLIYKWVVWSEVAQILKLNTLPTDPKYKWEKYVYSISADGKYYQIQTIQETNLISAIPFISQTYAAIDFSKYKVLVKWNFPSMGARIGGVYLPSLMFSGSSFNDTTWYQALQFVTPKSLGYVGVVDTQEYKEIVQEIQNKWINDEIVINKFLSWEDTSNTEVEKAFNEINGKSTSNGTSNTTSLAKDWVCGNSAINYAYNSTKPEDWEENLCSVWKVDGDIPEFPSYWNDVSWSCSWVNGGKSSEICTVSHASPWEYIVNITYDNFAFNTITWNGTYAQDSNVQIIATMKTWYAFDKWEWWESCNNKTTATCNFTMPWENVEVNAKWKCASNHHLEDDECKSNTKQGNCTEWELNTHQSWWNVKTVYWTWNTSKNERNIPYCQVVCEEWFQWINTCYHSPIISENWQLIILKNRFWWYSLWYDLMTYDPNKINNWEDIINQTLVNAKNNPQYGNPNFTIPEANFSLEENKRDPKLEWGCNYKEITSFPTTKTWSLQTQAILDAKCTSQNGSWKNLLAAQFCDSLSMTINGITYNDWYLPPEYDIKILWIWESWKDINYIDNAGYNWQIWSYQQLNYGWFQDGYYYSSRQWWPKGAGERTSYALKFKQSSNGNFVSNFNMNARAVRCVRIVN